MSEPRPNLLVYGVGHSGTSILTRMLLALGWSAGAEEEDAAQGLDLPYAENVSVRDCNRAALEGGTLPGEAPAVLAALRAPWVVKDPRFVVTLSLWPAAFAEAGLELPVLIWITRDVEAVRESYRRRGEAADGLPGTFGRTLDELLRSAAENYESWPGAKIRVAYEDLAVATALFVPDSADAAAVPASAGGVAQLRSYVELNRRQGERILELLDRLGKRREAMASLRKRVEHHRLRAEQKAKSVESLKRALQRRDDSIARLRDALRGRTARARKEEGDGRPA